MYIKEGLVTDMVPTFTVCKDLWNLVFDLPLFLAGHTH